MAAIAQRTTRSSGGHGELAALTRLTLDELGSAVAGIGQIHRAVADRAFGASGPGATPARVIHDGVARNVYGGLRLGAAALGRAAAVAIGPRSPISIAPRGATVLAAIDGLVGDVLERERRELAPPMCVRVDGRALTPAEFAAAAEPTARICVFLHGLMETEFSWGPEPYGERLQRDLGITPVQIRYNSGRRISQNGASLDELLEELVAAWPVQLEQVALVGHSMGGLVARSAAHQASLRGAAWVRQVLHVVSLGSPHMGAPLEQSVHYLSAALSALPETKPFGSFLRRRSGGIRDLRQGSLVDADWTECDPDALRARACEEVPLLEGATHCFVSATVTADPRHPLGRLLGDCLVLVPSAAGRSRTRRIGFRDEDGIHIGGANHFTLLRHPRVYAQLKTWLA
jgi:triacylglycerol esterase/lipase EstA (alpha/beta hydrolase family)